MPILAKEKVPFYKLLTCNVTPIYLKCPSPFTLCLGLVFDGLYSGEVGITLSLPQALFDSLMKGASQSQFLQAYLEGQITIDGDMQTLMQLQKLLPNMHNT